MPEKKPPQKPTNLRPYECDLVIDQHFTKLEISSYYEKHNKEYLEALKRKGIKLSEKELTEKLITDDLIRKFLVPQLDGKKGIISVGSHINWEAWKYYVYEPVYRENGKAYRLVWCCDDNNPHILGIMDCYRRKKHDIKLSNNKTE